MSLIQDAPHTCQKPIFLFRTLLTLIITVFRPPEPNLRSGINIDSQVFQKIAHFLVVFFGFELQFFVFFLSRSQVFNLDRAVLATRVIAGLVLGRVGDRACDCVDLVLL
jgi:uncharacterized membrane protein YadS